MKTHDRKKPFKRPYKTFYSLKGDPKFGLPTMKTTNLNGPKKQTYIEDPDSSNQVVYFSSCIQENSSQKMQFSQWHTFYKALLTIRADEKTDDKPNSYNSCKTMPKVVVLVFQRVPKHGAVYINDFVCIKVKLV